MAACPRCSSPLFFFYRLTATGRAFRCQHCGHIEHNTQNVVYAFKDLTSPPVVSYF